MQSLTVRRLRKHLASFALSNLTLALFVIIAYRFQLNTAIVGLLCLLVIVLHAVAVGFVSSAIVSIVAGACLVYLFAYPIFDFRMDDPVDAVALLVFLIASNVLAWLASKSYGTLRVNRQQLALAESVTQMVVWDRDLRTNVITFSGECNKLYGLAAGQRALTYDRWLGLIHSEDREQVRVHNSAALTHTHILDEEFRVVWPDGSVHWLLEKGTVFADEIGRPVRVAGVNIDITERKRAEAALRESEERLRFAQQVASIGTFDWNIETGVNTWTPELEALYGLPRGGFPGTQSAWKELVHPDDLDLTVQTEKEAFETGMPVDAEWRIILLDGTVRWILGRWQVFKNATSKPVRMMGVNMDITQRKYAEEALRQSEERFRLAVQATNDAVWDIDLTTGTVRWNEAYATLYGRPPASKSWQWWIDRIHPEDRECASGGLRSAISGNESTWTCEYRFQRADGAWAYIHDRAFIARDLSGGAWRVIGAMQDLTQSKRAEADLRESEERFRRVFEEGPLGLALVGKDYRFLKVNGALCQMVGYSEASLLQMTFADITHPDDLRADEELAERLFRGEIPFYRLRKRYVKKSGEIIWIDLTGSVIRDKEGEVMYALAMIEDITAVKRAQEIENQLASDLAASRDEIRALAASLIRAQEDERRRVSRELHDQICHQLGYLASDIGNLADSPSAPENLRAHLTAIRASVVKASQETHQIAYQMHTAILNDLGLVASLNALCRQFSDQYPNIALDFKNSGPPTPIPSELATCLYRVAQESLLNTAKHSGAKNVSVRLGLEKGAVVLTIQDDGVGFDPKAVKGHGGIGLISMMERAHSIKGKLMITAQPGHGAQITVEIPILETMKRF